MLFNPYKYEQSWGGDTTYEQSWGGDSTYDPVFLIWGGDSTYDPKYENINIF